jgi:hypothetical protein
LAIRLELPITLATIPCPLLLFGAISGKVLGIFVQESHQKCYGTYHTAADPLSDIIEIILFYGCWMRESLPDPDLANSAGNYEWVLLKNDFRTRGPRTSQSTICPCLMK